VFFKQCIGGIFGNLDLVGSHAYLNRAALVGCKNQLLSENYAKQLYTRRYLRDTSVTGRLGDIQVNSMNREYLRQFHYLTPTLDDLKLY
jgi:hypothetical protein